MPPRASSIGRDALVLAGSFAILAAIVLVWVALDRRPPEWDHANHLERAVLCARDLGRGDFEAALDRSSFYPPLVLCSAGLVYRVLPSDALAGQLVILAFLGLGMVATYGLARRLGGGPAGLAAALLFATAPFVVFLTVRFQIDLPLAAIVAVAVWTLVESERFSRVSWSLLTGVALGLGMLTKPSFAAYVGPPLLVVLARVRGRAAWLNAAVAVVVAGVISVPWYGPRLAGLPLQIGARSFRQAAESGHPDPLTWVGLTFYPRWLLPQLGVVAVLLFLAGVAIAVRRRQGTLLVALLVPFAIVELIQNKNLRYSLPLLPIAAVVAGLAFATIPVRARWWVGVAAGIVGITQVTSTLFAVPAPVHIAALGVPSLLGSPPRLDDWRHREILGVIAGHARAHPGSSPTVSVVPNAEFFSVSNFRYYALRDGLDLHFVRAWDERPIGVDYMIVKTGDQGPTWTAEKPRRIAERLASDPHLPRVFPSIGEFTLPDGSRATVLSRDVAPVAAPAATVARAVDLAVRQALPEVARDVEGLHVGIEWDHAIQRGRVRRLVITAASASIGELRRRDVAVLRVRDVRLVVDDVLVNPYSALADGHLEILDAGRVRLDRATVTGADLQAFVRGLRRFRGASVTLETGGIVVGLRGGGPAIQARVSVVPATDRPFAIEVDRLRYAGVPVPTFLVHWVVRNYDPTPRLAARLPVPVTMGRVTVTEDAIRIASDAALRIPSAAPREVSGR